MKKIITIAVAAALVLGIAATIYFVDFSRDNNRHSYIEVYFFDATSGRLVSELRQWPDTITWTEAIIGFLMGEPINSRLTHTWPGFGVADFITDIYMEDTMLVVTFSDLYWEIPPVEEVVFRSAFTLTMIGLEFVDSVLLRVDGYERQVEWLESAETIANAPPISPILRPGITTFTLFFGHESGEGLVIETYETMVSAVPRLRARAMLERLIAGPTTEGAVASIPAETRVLHVELHGESGIYVDLSSEFVTRFSGTQSQAQMMIASITNAVIENTGSPRTRRVFFLIDSERREEFHGVPDFNLGFVFDETMMLGYGQEDESEDYAGAD